MSAERNIKTPCITLKVIYVNNKTKYQIMFSYVKKVIFMLLIFGDRHTLIIILKNI